MIFYQMEHSRNQRKFYRAQVSSIYISGNYKISVYLETQNRIKYLKEPLQILVPTKIKNTVVVKKLNSKEMKRNCFVFAVVFMAFMAIHAQEKMEDQLPYYEIPESPETYTPGSVAARMIDALGFRYYWASEGLRVEDLGYKPNTEGRTTGETIDHILGLSNTILKATTLKPDPQNSAELTFDQKRKKTLNNLKKASDFLKKTTDLTTADLVFSEKFKLPFWNAINGPIVDAIGHSAQIVVLRRSSGNPMATGVNVLMGTKK